MADLLAQNIDKLKAILSESDGRKTGKSSVSKRSICIVADPAVEREFLSNVLSFCQQQPIDSVVEDLQHFLSTLSHCNIPTPWTSATDLLSHSNPNTGCLHNTKGLTGAKWVELEELFKDRLIKRLNKVCKEQGGTRNPVVVEETSQRILLPILNSLTLFIGGDSLLNEYTNARIDALRPIFLAWINQAARGGEKSEVTRLLESIFETEYQSGMSGVFGRATSPFQLLHSICLTPLLEEFVVTEQKNGQESLNLYFGFAQLSKWADDLHHRLTPFVDLFDASATVAGRRASAARIEEALSAFGDQQQTETTKKGRAADGISVVSNLSGGTSFEPLWTDRMYMLAKPPWLWSHHFVTKLSMIAQHCRESIDRMIDSMNRMCEDPAPVPLTSITLNGTDYIVPEAFFDILHLSKSITIVNNRHLVLDVGDDIRILEEAWISLASSIEAAANQYPEVLSQQNFDLLLSFGRFCSSAFKFRLRETSSAKCTLSRNCRIIIDQFEHSQQILLRLSMNTRSRWLQNYLLYDNNRNSNYSDVKSCQDDYVSPAFLMWYWTLRKEAMARMEDGETWMLAEVLERTVELILSRLAHTRVSQARQHQLWRDIWFVLRSTIDLLLYCNDFPVVFFTNSQMPADEKQLEWTIAGYCRKLLAVAIVLCLPFDRLYTLAKRGYSNMIEGFGRSKKRSIWYLLRPDLFLDDLPSTCLSDASLLSLSCFLQSLFSVSKPSTQRRRLLTLLCLHIKRNCLAVQFLRGLCANTVDNVEREQRQTVITSLLWILTFGEIDTDALANVLIECNASNADTGVQTSEARSIRQASWFQPLCVILKEAIGEDCLSVIRDRLVGQANKSGTVFLSSPCSCDWSAGKEESGDSESLIQAQSLRHRMGLLPVSLLHSQKAFLHSQGINLLAEVLQSQLGDQTGVKELIDYSLASIGMKEANPEEKMETGGGLDTTPIGLLVGLLRNQLSTFARTKQGMMNIDSVGDFIESHGDWLSKEIKDESGPKTGGKGGQYRFISRLFDTDIKEETAAIDDESTQSDELLSHVGVLTEVEFKCLLHNRPELWDIEMQMHEKTRKHVDSIMKLYTLENIE